MSNNSISGIHDCCKSQCNGDWEHSYGIRIDTINNPGWSIFIDILETKLEGVAFESINIERSEEDWL